MRIVFLFLILQIQLSLYSQKSETYAIDSASIEQPGIPKGELLHFKFDSSKVFPGTTREVWIYIPVQYKADKPACVYVNQDGIQWKAPTVFDNLIHSGQMPVTIGVFVTPGRVLADNNPNAVHRHNRSFEYDGLGDAYARFLLEELFPAIEKKKAGDGRKIMLSKSGNDRAIGGSSSGAVCAFTAAWERPDAFSRVFSAIGTYTGLRGADRYPILIRKYEPKPIRIFLQDGTNDLNIYAGDWWKANEMMERSLSFAGYEVNHVWGEGDHNNEHGTAVFPQAMRWLWKDWPTPVAKGTSKNRMLSDLLIPGEEWQLVGEGYQFTEGTGGNAAGEVYFQDVPQSKTYKVSPGSKPVLLYSNANKASGTAFGPDGSYYTAAGGSKQVIRYNGKDQPQVIADSIAGYDSIVAHNGNIYLTAPVWPNGGKLFLVKPSGEKIQLDDGLKFPNGLTLSPDQTQLYVTESGSHWVWIYRIKKDGTLEHKQRFGWLHVPDTEENAWSDGLKCDTAGRIFVTSRIGIQVLDQVGRVNAILPAPPSNSQTSNVYFGGPDLNVLYVTAGDKVFSRKLRTKGCHAFQVPIKRSTPGM
jgi:sugar lactone lactonase YvrE/enterochelin esterase-like enzyme